MAFFNLEKKFSFCSSRGKNNLLNHDLKLDESFNVHDNVLYFQFQVHLLFSSYIFLRFLKLTNRLHFFELILHH